MSRFKTELCNNLIELGTCKYGDRCHYAHGAHELRQVSRRHPKYRTERCKNYELTGKCPFGPRCSYVHPKPDYDRMIEQLTKYVQHTKAPKPDSEDEDDNISLFTRTATSASLTSNCGSISSESNRLAFGDEANKENQFFIKNPSSSYSSSFITSKEVDHDIEKKNQQLSTIIDHPFANHKENSILQPLTVNHSNDPQALKAIQLSQPRVAMRILSSNNQTQQESNSNSSSSPFNNAPSNPFGISNPLSDYFNSADFTSGSPLVPNKQFYTRF